jgi:hypothetical protein
MLGQVKINENSNEFIVTAAPLDMTWFQGAVVTIDAIRLRRKTADSDLASLSAA